MRRLVILTVNVLFSILCSIASSGIAIAPAGGTASPQLVGGYRQIPGALAGGVERHSRLLPRLP